MVEASRAVAVERLVVVDAAEVEHAVAMEAEVVEEGGRRSDWNLKVSAQT